MSLLDEAVAARDTRGPQCSVGIAKEAHPELSAEIDELVDAVASRAIYATTATRIAIAHGLLVKDDAILRHSKRGTPDGCRCR